MDDLRKAATTTGMRVPPANPNLKHHAGMTPAAAYGMATTATIPCRSRGNLSVNRAAGPPGETAAAAALVRDVGPGYEKTPAAADIRAGGSETSRSSSPATDSSRYAYPASTGSSCATSCDCSCPARDEHDDACGERCGSRRWEDDPPVPREGSPVLGSDPSMPSRPSSTKPMAPSRLRNNLVSAGQQCDSADSTGSQLTGDEFEPEDDSDSSDEWSGENDSLDGTVIAAVNGDLPLAAFLIPLLHRAAQSSVRNKVESWQSYQTATRDGGESAAGGGRAGQGSRDGEEGSGSNQRKRRRRSGSEDGEGGDEENGDGPGDGGGGAGGGDARSTPPDSPESPNLACPFHKQNPLKYRTQHTASPGTKKDYYRACMGPGFKNIQRLKEHLKRKHYPVQCGRCYHIFKFNGTDRTIGINQLNQHLQQAEPCERGNKILQEGISDQQWAELEKQNRKKNQEAHKVEKWFEIWRVLFPDVKQPDTPWYADAETGISGLSASSNDSETFTQIFRAMLDYRVQQGDITLPPGDENTAQRLTDLATQAFDLYRSVRGGNTDTSSSGNTGTRGNGAFSVLGGSSTLPSAQTHASSSLSRASAFSSAPTLQLQPQHQHQNQHQHQHQHQQFAGVPNATATPPMQYGLAAIPMPRAQPLGAALSPHQQYQQLLAATNFNAAAAGIAAAPPEDLGGMNTGGYYLPLVFPAGPIPGYPGVAAAAHHQAAFGAPPAQLPPGSEYYGQDPAGGGVWEGTG